ncbi:hypothetical protein ACQP1W_02105 [Spirillospora sp. CA-255316]
MLAVAAGHRVALVIDSQRADQASATLPRRAWQKLSAGPGAKGRRFCNWALIDIDRDLSGCRCR